MHGCALLGSQPGGFRQALETGGYVAASDREPASTEPRVRPSRGKEVARQMGQAQTVRTPRENDRRAAFVNTGGGKNRLGHDHCELQTQCEGSHLALGDVRMTRAGNHQAAPCPRREG